VAGVARVAGVVMTAAVRRGDLRDAEVEQYSPGACRKLGRWTSPVRRGRPRPGCPEREPQLIASFFVAERTAMPVADGMEALSAAPGYRVISTDLGPPTALRFWFRCEGSPHA
jgi:hypothetical protein